MNPSSLKLLSPANAAFSLDEEGYLTLKAEGESTPYVRLKRALPYRMPGKYICVCDREDKELGIITDLSEWPKDQQAMLNRELDRLYYVPRIEKIISAKNRMGYLYFEAVADGVQKSFAVRDPSRNIRFIAPDLSPTVQLTDTEGNRYRIDDPEQLDRKSRRTVETYLI